MYYTRKSKKHRVEVRSTGLFQKLLTGADTIKQLTAYCMKFGEERLGMYILKVANVEVMYIAPTYDEALRVKVQNPKDPKDFRFVSWSRVGGYWVEKGRETYEGSVSTLVPTIEFYERKDISRDEFDRFMKPVLEHLKQVYG